MVEPAGIARQDKKEIAIHHSQTIAAVGDAITFLSPSRRAGSVALSLNVLNFGDQQITDAGGIPIGVVLPRNILLAGTYAAEFGKRVNAGLTYKRLWYRVDCSGVCTNVSTFTVNVERGGFRGSVRRALRVATDPGRCGAESSARS